MENNNLKNELLNELDNQQNSIKRIEQYKFFECNLFNI